MGHSESVMFTTKPLSPRPSLTRISGLGVSALLFLFAAEGAAQAAELCTGAELDEAVALYNSTTLAEGAQADAEAVDSCYADNEIVTFTWKLSTSMTVVCLDDVAGCNVRILQGSVATPDVWGVSGKDDLGVETYYQVWSAAITDLSIIGSEADDWISSLHGMSSTTPSRVASRGGDDIVLSGLGDDIIRAGGGDDTVFSGAGYDYVRGSNGADWIDGGDGDDLLEGGNDDDYVFGGAGDDIIVGYTGEDVIYAGTGDDDIDGGSDDDIIGGSGGLDSGTAGAGDDLVLGQASSDTMSGGDGDDVMIGGGGLDNMTGDGGFDSCSSDTVDCEDNVPNRSQIVTAFEGLELFHAASDASAFAAAGSFSAGTFAALSSERTLAETECASFRVTLGALLD